MCSTHKHDIEEHFRETFVAVEKQYILRIASVSVALVSQQAKRMHTVILSPVVYLAVLYLSTLSHKKHDFRKKKY
jgi:hypothetical protein